MNKQVRKWIGCMLAVVMLVSLLGACKTAGDSPLDPNDPVEITLWHYYNGAQLAAFDSMVDQFNRTVGKDTGVQVATSSMGGVNDLGDEVLKMAEGSAGAGGMPDIFAAYADIAYSVKEMGLTVDLGNYMTEEEIGEYVESYWQEGCLPADNAPTIFPMAKSTELVQMDALAWNEFLEAAGPAVSDANLETWDGLTEAAALYYDYSGGKALFGIDSPANYLYTTMRQQGISLLENRDGKGVMNLDEDALRSAFRVYYDNIVRGWFAHVGRYRSDDVKTGEIIGFIGSTTGSIYFPTVITYEDGSEKPAELAVYPVPTFENGAKVAIQQGAGMVVTKSDERREYAAVSFLKWLTEQEQNLRFSTDSAYLPVKKETLLGEEMGKLLEEMAASGDEEQEKSALVFRKSLEQLETHESYYTDPFPGLYQVRTVLESLRDVAADGRQQVLDLVDQGVDYDEAVELVLEQDAFREWVDHIVESTGEYFA